MKITFLGTNGWYNYKNTETTCIFVQSNKVNLILDLGSGIKNLNNIIFKDRPTYLFISHLHLDHIIGIHYLSMVKKLKDLTIIVHKNYYNNFKRIFNKPYTLKHTKYKRKIKFMTFAKNKNCKVPFKFLFKKLKHSDPSYGFKFFLENKIISYCTDTKYCNNIFELSKNSDLLILECNQFKMKNNFHLSFQEIKRNIEKFKTNKISLIHFGPENFKTLKDRHIKLKKKIKMNKKIQLFVTKDLDVLSI